MTKLTILVAPADGSGHLNACIGVAQILINRRHRVVFVANKSSREGQLTALGFQEELYDENDSKDEKVDWIQSFITDISPYLRQSPIDHHKGYGKMKWILLYNKAIKENNIFKQIIERVKPHLILIDNLCVSPSLITAGIPWVRIVSSQVLFGIDDERTPPSGSGFAMNSSKDQWHKYRQICEELYKDIWNEYNEYMVSLDAPSLPYLKFMPSSPFANLYMYPKEIDYTDVRPLPPKWHQFDNFLRTTPDACNEEFELTEEFMGKPGKLIYFSLGSIACADSELMLRLISILSKSPNKLIVSKGPFDENIVLGDNMCGKKYVPQITVIESVDLVITHGGNNTITEIFYYGKPLIVLPIFSDQFDNAQRIQEMGFGLSLNAYHCEEHELLQAIETVLTDNIMIKKMKDSGNRIRSKQKDNNIRLAKLIESIVEL